MYRELARYYDLIYANKNYSKESALLRAVARKEGRSGGRELLDVGCGTGRHLEHLRRWYRCTGVDLSPAMLGIAKRRLPNERFLQGSMESFSLAQRFDVITCLFGAIAYTRTRSRMERAVANMAAHLKPGGILLIAPFNTPSQWVQPHIGGRIGQGPRVVVARAMRSLKLGPRIGALEGHYLIATNKGISHVVEEQELGLFQDREIQRAMRSAGLRSHHLKKFLGSANGLHVGLKPLK